MINFQFHPEKAVQAMAYVVRRLGPMDKIKLMKLLYLADREHFIEVGFPITGDQPRAMRWGPVPSDSLDLLNGEPLLPADRVFRFLHVDDNRVELRQSPGEELLTDSERRVLDQVIGTWGRTETRELIQETHRLPEYVECYVQGTSSKIPYDRIAKASGSPSRFRRDRPVITEATASQIDCPFPPADPDL